MYYYFISYFYRENNKPRISNCKAKFEDSPINKDLEDAVSRMNPEARDIIILSFVSLTSTQYHNFYRGTTGIDLQLTIQ